MSLMAAIAAAALAPHLKLTAFVLATFGHNGREIRPGLATVARMVGKEQRRVRADIVELLRLGVLVSITDRKGGRGRAATYAIQRSVLEALALPPNADVGVRVLGPAGPVEKPVENGTNADVGVRVSAEASAPAAANADVGVRVSRENADVGVRVSGQYADVGVRGSKDQDQDQDQKQKIRRYAPALPVSVFEVRAHVLAAVHRTVEAGGRFLAPDGTVNRAEVSAEVRAIVAGGLGAEWDQSREIEAMIDAALGRRASLSAAAVRSAVFRQREARGFEARGAVR